MGNLLLHYMDSRYENALAKPKEPGPVITISRECGCDGIRIAEMLVAKINSLKAQSAKEWKWTSKEILNLASEELKIHPELLDARMGSKEMGFLDELVASFTDKYYVHNQRIRRVIEEVIRNFAVQGHTVIIGRGSGYIAHDIPKSFHVKLVAPFSYRAARIAEKHNLTLTEGQKYVEKIDKQRDKFRQSFGPKNDLMPYSIALNCESLFNNEIVDLIYQGAQLRGLF